MNYRNDKHHAFSQGLGHKIKNIAKFAGAVEKYMIQVKQFIQ